jgi:hypothetical protein
LAKPTRKKLHVILNDIRIDLAILLVFWIVLFRELLTGSAWLHDDFVHQYWPASSFLATSLAKGIFPFWNPYQFGGMPFFADPGTGTLYPFNLLFSLFAANGSLNPLVVQITILLNFLIASVACFFVGKELKLSNFASLIFGLIFPYSSYMLIHAIHMNLLESVTWLPLLFLLYLRFVRTYRFIYMILAGIAMSLSILAGYPQVYFFIYIIFGVLFLHQIYQKYKDQDSKRIVHLIGGFTVYAAISAGISAVQILPALEFSQNTERIINIGYEYAKQGSVHPYDLLTLYVPKLFGTFNWNEEARELGYWSVKKAGGHQEGAWMFTVSTLYITILPLLLLVPFLRFALKNLLRPPAGSVASKEGIFLYASLMVLTILYAFGGNFFLHKLFFDYVPLFDRFRNAGHVTFIFAFFTCLLTAYCVNELVEDKNAIKKYFGNAYFAVLAVLVAGVFIYISTGSFKSLSLLTQNKEIYEWIINQTNWSSLLAALYIILLFLYIRDKVQLNGFSIALTLVLLIELYVFGFNQNNGNVNPSKAYSQNSQLITQLKEELKTEPFRIKMREGGDMLFQRYQGSVDRVPFLEGYNVLLLQKRFPYNKPDSGSTQWIDLMNIKYKIDVNKANRTMSLVENPSYVKRASMFYNVKVVEDDSLLRKYMESKEFDYRKTLVLEKNPPSLELPDTSVRPTWNAEITEYGQNRAKVEVETSENGFLLLSEVWYPAWKAYIDGKEEEIYRADNSLRAVYVERGKHVVEFVYESDSFRKGLMISIATIVLTIGGLVYFGLNRKKL